MTSFARSLMAASFVVPEDDPQRSNISPARGPGQAAPAPVAKTQILGFALARMTRRDAAERLVAMALARQGQTVHFMNAHCFNTARHNGDYRAALGRADLLLPDGSGVALAARLAGAALGENLNGTDLFPLLCQAAAARGASIFLLVGRPGRAAKAAAAMQAIVPGLQIAGTWHGYWADEEEAAVIAMINASRASIVLVGLSVPAQECWLDRVRPRLATGLAMGVGGLFDYYSGAIPRAPLVLRRSGCEWIWRWIQEPRRLLVRYSADNAQFLVAAARHAWRVRRIDQRLSLAIKRAFDLVVASVALVALLPLIVLVILAIKAEDGGPAFFRQTRIGAMGQPFRIWKFRTMVVDAEKLLARLADRSERAGACFKLARDPRVTRVGRVLRRWSLDELPQLLNVMQGHMSVVGPRPALPREVLQYDAAALPRLAGQPGLTCEWQVSGRADLPFDDQVRLDIKYLTSRSLVGDLGLVLRTVPAVVSARGAY